MRVVSEVEPTQVRVVSEVEPTKVRVVTVCTPLSRCVYGLLASVSTSNPASLTPHMEAIAKRMFESLDCTDVSWVLHT